MKKRQKVIAALVFLALALGICFSQKIFPKVDSLSVPPFSASGNNADDSPDADSPERMEGNRADQGDNQEQALEDTEPKPVQIKDLRFVRTSGRELTLLWPDQEEPYVGEYLIRKRKSGEAEDWQLLGTVASDGAAGGRELSFTDTLEDAAPQQYMYRVDVTVADRTRYEAVEGKPVLASNILICIDPGHYAGKNLIREESSTYIEGDFTLALAGELRRILEGDYGVTVCMTREIGDISMGGYANEELDSSHINLRGEYAKGADLFLSLHTNGNFDDANGYPTFYQPVAITKPIIIANRLACDDSTALAVGNAIGSRLARENARMGIASVDVFRTVTGRGDVIPWAMEWNDALDAPGTVCCKIVDSLDYYGVLRGSAAVGVSGLLIEHGFHTVRAMREMAASGELQRIWAQADAEGIAEGFGLETRTEGWGGCE